LNLAMQALRNGLMPIMTQPPMWVTISPFDREVLLLAEPTRREFEKRAAENPEGELEVDGPVLLTIGNGYASYYKGWKFLARAEHSLVVLEDTTLSEAAVAKAKTFAKNIVASGWNLGLLRARGIENSVLVMQGVDPSLFCPRPKSGVWDNFFVIFSGGKLEYRKGQDIVIAAVRKFQEKHPETVLALAWQNSEPAGMSEIVTSGLVSGVPSYRADGAVDFRAWLGKQGIKGFVDIGPQLNWHMGAILRDADVAVFASRAEGGTNLVAMECMASGIPTILSANTGHLDLITDETCYALRKQTPARATEAFKGVEGWGESDVEEMVEIFERVYRDREEARKRGLAGAEAMKKFSWENQMGVLFDEVGVGE
jgi:glycosyltransferase involved in cell wall biosynthesis